VFTYAVTTALAIIAACANLNSIIKAYDAVHKGIRLAEAASPFPGVVVHVSISDIVSAGSFLATGEVLISILSYISLITLIPWILPGIGKHLQRIIVGKESSSWNTSGHWSRGWKVLIAWWIFSFVWSLCSAAVSLDWALHRSAKTSAYLDGVKLPDSIIVSIQQQLGIHPNYWAQGFTRFFAISPWPMLAFALLSIILSVLALGAAPPGQTVDEQQELESK